MVDMLISDLLSDHLFSLCEMFWTSLSCIEFANMGEVDLQGHCENKVPPELIIVSIDVPMAINFIAKSTVEINQATSVAYNKADTSANDPKEKISFSKPGSCLEFIFHTCSFART